MLDVTSEKCSTNLADEFNLLNIDLQPVFLSSSFPCQQFKRKNSVLMSVFYYCIDERDTAYFHFLRNLADGVANTQLNTEENCNECILNKLQFF